MFFLGQEFEFSESHFSRIKKFVSAHTGIVLSDAKKHLVYGRLSSRVRKHFAGSFDAFCDALASNNPDEQDFLINAITTNLTAFFRESHHFDYLHDTVIPELLQTKQKSKRIRIWSAGCSSGEEAYSIAMTLYEAIPDLHQWDVKILATDLDANVIAQARSAIYNDEQVNNLPPSMVKKWFSKGKGDNAGLVKVKPQLQKMIIFKRLNLLQPWPMKGPFDVIFCRNVVIYFDKATQTQLFGRYADILEEKGHLFIGHSETLHNMAERFSPLGNTIYRRLK